MFIYSDINTWGVEKKRKEKLFLKSRNIPRVYITEKTWKTIFRFHFVNVTWAFTNHNVDKTTLLLVWMNVDVSFSSLHADPRFSCRKIGRSVSKLMFFGVLLGSR